MSSRSQASRIIASAMLAVVLGACGFQLRGTAIFPFTTIAMQSSLNVMLAELERNIASGSNAKVLRDPVGAQAVFQLLGEAREKVILSLNTQGRVREYQLRYRVAYRVHDGKGGEFLAPNEIALRRDISFNDQVLAKESEEALLYREMQSDMVQQIMRRLAASKLRRPEDD
jgi:LPS-assembly lipoprotein